ncbi:MAG: hypothetical protein JJT76_15265 [Clostridiaceae bacterium]|nr:hypothetical protein [Clostridiaceae bacterium]
MIDKLITSNNQSIKSNIVSKQKKIEERNIDTKNLIAKKEFISSKLRDIIIPLAKGGYCEVIADELEQNYPALLELFIYENVRELILNGQKYSIISRGKRGKSN